MCNKRRSWSTKGVDLNNHPLQLEWVIFDHAALSSCNPATLASFASPAELLRTSKPRYKTREFGTSSPLARSPWPIPA